MHKNPHQAIRKVAFSIAMKGEAQGLIEGLSMHEEGFVVHGHSPLWYSRRLDGENPLEIALVVAGTDPIHRVDRIGTETAVLGSAFLCASFQPDLLFNVGTCGGFEARGGSIGELYLASEAFLFHGRRIPLEGFEGLGEGRIPALEAEALRKVLGAERGIVSTSNSFSATSEDLAFFEAEHVSAKDMEATALARLARDLSIPFLALKGVTDLIDHPEPEEQAFLRNYAGVVEELTSSLLRGVEWLQEGRSIADFNR